MGDSVSARAAPGGGGAAYLVDAQLQLAVRLEGHGTSAAVRLRNHAMGCLLKLVLYHRVLADPLAHLPRNACVHRLISLVPVISVDPLICGLRPRHVGSIGRSVFLRITHDGLQPRHHRARRVAGLPACGLGLAPPHPREARWRIGLAPKHRFELIELDDAGPIAVPLVEEPIDILTRHPDEAEVRHCIVKLAAGNLTVATRVHRSKEIEDTSMVLTEDSIQLFCYWSGAVTLIKRDFAEMGAPPVRHENRLLGGGRRVSVASKSACIDLQGSDIMIISHIMIISYITYHISHWRPGGPK